MRASDRRAGHGVVGHGVVEKRRARALDPRIDIGGVARALPRAALQARDDLGSRDPFLGVRRFERVAGSARQHAVERLLGQLLAAHARCRTNAAALRVLYNFDKAPAAAPASPR